MRKIPAPDRPSCSTEDDDTAEHTLIVCDYFSHERRLLEERVGKRILDSEDVSATMLLSEEGWLPVEEFAANVIGAKGASKRTRRRRQQTGREGDPEVGPAADSGARGAAEPGPAPEPMPLGENAHQDPLMQRLN